MSVSYTHSHPHYTTKRYSTHARAYKGPVAENPSHRIRADTYTKSHSRCTRARGRLNRTLPGSFCGYTSVVIGWKTVLVLEESTHIASLWWMLLVYSVLSCRTPSVDQFSHIAALILVRQGVLTGVHAHSHTRTHTHTHGTRELRIHCAGAHADDVCMCASVLLLSWVSQLQGFVSERRRHRLCAQRVLELYVVLFAFIGTLTHGLTTIHSSYARSLIHLYGFG